MSDPAPPWEEAEVVPALGVAEVHVWHIRLDAAPLAAWDILSSDEQARARQYRFDVHRNRFVSCRAQLRRLLGQYAGDAPERLTFEYGPHGKPALAGATARKSIAFNVSHARDSALLAFTPASQVGVDIESSLTRLDFQNLADRFMSQGEAAHIRGAVDSARAFYACWTRKEAWMKAIGCGLSDPLSRFDTSSTLGHMTGAVACDDFPRSVWTLHELAPEPHLLACVAVEGANIGVRRLRPPLSRKFM
ncbi:MAG TPA: 4'-phosphopantetheinyl transferase superfamily protein [Tepidisphaeraceae bacterium]|nr:4'-phosphopantetheinyl transferase superfamily protein [Tepidisphaeraceae bacterium]